MLHGIDYEFVKKRRTENFAIFHHRFKNINQLELSVPEGAFMYPLYIRNGAVLRKALQKEKIYIPMLWGNVLSTESSTLEKDMAENILPLPCDQRYGEGDILHIIRVLCFMLYGNP